MKKVFTAVLLVMCMLLSGCGEIASTSDQDFLLDESEQDFSLGKFEATIRKYGKELTQGRHGMVNDGIDYRNMTFVQGDNFIEFFAGGESIGGINYSGYKEIFDDEYTLWKPSMTRIKKIPSNVQKMFDEAKKIVKQYVKCSSVIKEKDDVINKINSIELKAGRFEKQYKDNVMATYSPEDTIYLNTRLKKQWSTYIFIHELIHVVNSVTAENSKYEKTYLNGSLLTEAITDVIAINLSVWCGIDAREQASKCKYAKCYDTVYTMMSNRKFDIFEAYFYPDTYQSLIDMTSPGFTEALFVSLFTLDDFGYSNANNLLCNYYVNLK